MTRLFVSALRGGEIVVEGADWRYLTVVRRARVGDAVTLFDGAGREAPAVIAAIDATRAVLRAEEPRAAATAGLALTLVVALLKGEKMDLVVQKTTELGVTRIVPAATARSVVRLDAERAAGRVTRWRKIAREAARQCGRADAPEIAAPLPFVEALAAAGAPGAASAPGAGAPGGTPGQPWRALLHEGPGTTPLRAAFPEEPPPSAAIAVGPEGGFTADEVAAARDAGWLLVGFGPRILRAETAALAAVTVVAHALGDLG